MTQKDTKEWDNLRKMLVEIYNCAGAWDNDDGKMAEANEKTPEDILATYLQEAQQEAVDSYKERLLEELQKNKKVVNYRIYNDPINTCESTVIGNNPQFTNVPLGIENYPFEAGFNSCLAKIKSLIED